MRRHGITAVVAVIAAGLVLTPAVAAEASR